MAHENHVYLLLLQYVIHHIKSEDTADSTNAVRKVNEVSGSSWKAPNLYDFMAR